MLLTCLRFHTQPASSENLKLQIKGSGFDNAGGQYLLTHLPCESCTQDLEPWFYSLESGRQSSVNDI